MAARRILLAATSSALALIALAAAPADGATVTEFSQGIGGTPADLVAGPDGNIWYAQALFSKVGRLNLATGTATEFAGPLGTAGITVGPDQNLWVVGSADSGHKLDMVTTAGVVTSPITLAAAGEQVTLGPDGRLWVTESGGHIEAATVGTASPTGSFPGPGTPLGIVAGPDGNLWFTEKFGDAVGRITTAGAVTSFPTPTANSGPTFIARGPDGNLWFTEVAANKIGRITTSGAISEFPLAAGASPWGITAGPDGGVWFAEQALDRVGRIDPVTGAIREVPVPTPNAAPGKITVGPDGNLWVAEENVRKIARISAFFPPVATTGGAGSVTSLAAALAGTIDARGDATSYRFDYGTTPGYGSSTPATSAGAGIGATTASARLAGLAPATTYHYRLVATNSNGSSVGADHTFASW